MPELPEVETVVRSLRPHLVGRLLGRVIAADPRVLRGATAPTFGRPRRGAKRRPVPSIVGVRALAGRLVTAVQRVGKFIRIVTVPFSPTTEGRGGRGDRRGTRGTVPFSEKELGKGDSPLLILTIHLGMSGRLLAVPGEAPCPKHAYFRIALATDPPVSSEFRIPNSEIKELRFVNPRWCMGGVWVNPPGDPDAPTAKLGPDPLEITQAGFVALLNRRRQAKALLLDQAALAGMGNIYCDESLFAARIHPRAIASELTVPQRELLWRVMRGRLRESIRKGGSSIRDYRDANGQAGFFQLTLKVYGKPGEPCPACSQPIEHCITAGRSTHFCPRCQRG